MKTLFIALSFAIASASFASTPKGNSIAEKAIIKQSLSLEIGDNDTPKDPDPKPRG